MKASAFLTAICLCASLHAQDAVHPLSMGGAAPSQANSAPGRKEAPIRTVREKWNHFLRETASPLTLGGGIFNAAFSQVTNGDPKYGVNGAAFAERFGASIADIATQNFFGDFIVASALHEDPRYYRKGEGHGFWSRTGYAISRALVIRKESGYETFNYDNAVGSALSSGFSNLYYPAASRGGKATFMHFAIDVADNGFVNLAPEFWPDFRGKVLRRHP